MNQINQESNTSNNESNWDDEIHNIVELAMMYETRHPVALVTKVFEEGGEFAESILKNNGHLQYKKDVGDPFEEAADVFNAVIATIVTNYPEMTSEDISKKLLEHFITKGKKYANIIK